MAKHMIIFLAPYKKREIVQLTNNSFMREDLPKPLNSKKAAHKSIYGLPPMYSSFGGCIFPVVTLVVTLRSEPP